MQIFTEEINGNQKGDDGNTALFWAARGRDAIIVDILLRYGAEIETINAFFETPLVIASKVGHIGVVEKAAGRIQRGD